MRILNVLLIIVMTAGSVCAAGAAGKGPAKADKKAAAVKKADWKARVFTAEELGKYNGQDGMPVYAAVDGIVYDLSGSKYWKTGSHMRMHQAGADLSEDIHKKAPPKIHKGGRILEKMPKVGVMEGYMPAGPVAVRAVRKDEVGREAVCPVMGEKFKVTAETKAADYKGKAYYFCCAGCDASFSKDPEKYLKKK